MRHMRPTPQALTKSAPSETLVEFDASNQSLDALRAAAYRLLGSATCKIDTTATTFICRLAPRTAVGNVDASDSEDIKDHFLELVTDENLRESVGAKTEAVRNLILSLAFGSLVAESNEQ